MNIRGRTIEELKRCIENDIKMLGDRQEALSFILGVIEIDSSYDEYDALKLLKEFTGSCLRKKFINDIEKRCIDKYIKMLKGWY